MKNTSIFPKPLYWIFVVAIFLGAFALRMVDIDDIPLDFHPTRQLFSALKARGIYYQTAPEIPDWQREMAVDQWKLQATIEPEIVENLAVLAYRINGEDDLALPRIFSAIFWMVSALFLFLTARKLTSPDGSLLALSFYLFLPYGVYASRSFQPDPLMMMLLAVFIWSLANWSDAEKWRWAILAGLFGGLAILVKMVAVFFVAGAAGGAILKRRRLRDALIDIRIWVMAILSLLPTALYFYYGIVVKGFLTRQFGGRFLPELLSTPSFYLRWGLNLDQVVGFFIIALAPLGLLLLPKSKNGMLRGLWIGYIAYGFYFNYHFSTHDYYQIPFILVAALSLAPLGEMLSKTIRTRRKGWLPPTLLLGVWTLALLGAAWTVRTELRANDYRLLATTYREIGDQLRDEGKTVALTEDYGYRLNYWGWLNVTHFPSAGDLWYQEKRGDPQEFEQVFEKNTKNRDFFLITDFDEWEKQDDLREYLTENYPPYAEDDAYLIFELTPKSTNTPAIPSLNSNWNLLEEQADRWSSDAYLTAVAFYVTGKDNGTIFAEYRSLSKEGIALFMYLNQAGEISSRTQDYSENSHSGNDVPISQKDWEIDSQDAIKIFSREKSISSCFSTSGVTTVLMLSNSIVLEPAWELDIFDCPEEPNLQIYFINAQTGETIDNPW